MHTRACVCMCTSKYVHSCTKLHTRTPMQSRAHTYTDTYIYTHAHTHTHTLTRAHVRILKHTDSWTHSHT